MVKPLLNLGLVLITFGHFITIYIGLKFLFQRLLLHVYIRDKIIKAKKNKCWQIPLAAMYNKSVVLKEASRFTKIVNFMVPWGHKKWRGGGGVLWKRKGSRVSNPFPLQIFSHFVRPYYMAEILPIWRKTPNN